MSTCFIAMDVVASIGGFVLAVATSGRSGKSDKCSAMKYRVAIVIAAVE